MVDKSKIEALVLDRLKGTEKFLVDIEVSATNVIDVFIDGDDGISIGECVQISRLIEANLDREIEDFELRVSSPGLDKPFKLLRQYKKYIDRDIRVELAEGDKIKGKLIAADESEITLEIKTGKKGKDIKKETFAFDTIKAAKPEISFK